MGTVVKHLVYDAFGRIPSRRREPAVRMWRYGAALSPFPPRADARGSGSSRPTSTTAWPFDPDTGLQNNFNRWYDARIGRWPSEPSLEYRAGDSSLYRHLRNNPIIFVDPSGLACCGDQEYDPCSQSCSNGTIQAKSRLCIRYKPSHCWIYAQDVRTGAEHTYGRLMERYGGATASGMQTDVELDAGRAYTVERWAIVCALFPTFVFGWG